MSECRAFKECYFKPEDEKKKTRKKERIFSWKIFTLKRTILSTMDIFYLLFSAASSSVLHIYGYSSTSVRGRHFLSLKFHFLEILFCFFFRNEMLFHWFHRVSVVLINWEMRNVPVTKIGKLYHSSIFLSRCVYLFGFFSIVFSFLFSLSSGCMVSFCVLRWQI